METYLISDTHFGHNNILTFLNPDGSNLRTFDSVEDMDEHMIQQWNSVVRPQDKVIHLGDVVINRKALVTLARLNGKKKLIIGNHDIHRHEEYAKYFYEQKAYRVFDGAVFSHIPIHTDSLARWSFNAHGHLHSGNVKDSLGNMDPRYICMCVEQEHVNYTPVPWYRVKEIVKDRGLILK